MEEAGVPVVPGYHGDDQDPQTLASEAIIIGYPVLIKAVAGGGGKGMRLVERPDDFETSLAAAKAEAKGAFGNDKVLIEKFVAKPRHIEVQIFGDGERTVHLFERDCSLQRRHQKVIEEAPAPGMTAEMREAMGSAAVRAAQAIGYKGAGTVEFIVDASEGLRPDRFYFMEMNARLQVEHPVTEVITGYDLVSWQLLVASGAPLPAAQDELKIMGHSFEARLYAEDVPAGFLPATGTLSHLQFPNLCRADTGVRAGDDISPWYDPMIAKIIVHGVTREHALQKLQTALARTEVAGTVTNLAFLRALAGHEGFGKGEVDTGLIARDLETLVVAPNPCSRTMALAAVGALGLDDRHPLQGFALWSPLRQTARLRHGDTDVEATLETLGEGAFRVSIGDKTHDVQNEDGWRIDGQSVAARVVRHAAGLSVFWGNSYHFVVPDPLAVATATEDTGQTLAPMPGLVKAVFVTSGATVTVGDPLAILEAMKMEHTLTAGQDGVVADVLVAEGDQVAAGTALIRLEEAE